MATVFPELPGWRFTVTERSASVYEVVAHRDRGGSVTLSGVDYDAVLEQALNDAAAMESGQAAEATRALSPDPTGSEEP